MPSARATCLQIATKVEGNPIMQDEKKGKARLYHGPIFWNYGCLPQTWEDPNVKGDADVGGAFGDDDPVDVVEIGAASQEMGAVVPVKPLGVLSMIDDGEVGTLPLRAHLHKRTTHGQRATIAPHCCHALPLPSPTKAAQPPRARPWPLARQLDWKVIAISASDEHAKDINDVGDIEKYYPGTVSGIREWFRWYKTPDGAPPRPPAAQACQPRPWRGGEEGGTALTPALTLAARARADKPVNGFGHNEEALNAAKAVEVIKETNEHYNALMAGKTDAGKLSLK